MKASSDPMRGFGRLFCLPALALLGACAMGPGELTATDAELTAADAARPLPASLELLNFRILSERVAGGGPPKLSEIATMKERGYVGIINLRTDAEPGVAAEEEAARAAGLAYVHVPVSGSSLDLMDAVAVHQALMQMPAGGHILLHCGSGNRAGAIWGLAKSWARGYTPEQAVWIGRNAGMRSDALAEKVFRELSAADSH